jgi:DNA-binding LacI/PurR family transcriptional regulator
LDDINCRGVLRAMLRLGVEPPAQIRLVSHATRGVELSYHKPVTRVEYDPAEQARAAIEIMLGLQRQPDSEPRIIWVPGRLVKGETT